MTFREGKRQDVPPQSDREHFIGCTICGETFDMCDLGEVLDYLHGQEIEEEPTQH